MAGMVIAGGGQAAGQAVASLRQAGYKEEITLFGAETHPPYQRPPLSKQYLSGEYGLERVYLRPEKFYSDRDVDLKLGVTVSGINPSAHTISTSTGNSMTYDKLLIATGSRPRILDVPGSDLNGIYYLRTIADVDAIRQAMQSARNLCIIGGGYIGLEVASIAVTSGLNVNVLEMESRVLKRVTTPEMSEFYHELHSSHGVNITLNSAVEGFAGKDRVTEILCGNSRIEADLVIIGIGILPNIELAEKAGLACDNGILVDECCHTSEPDIYAAGDCTNHPNPILGRRLRLESVPNAMEQARVAATNMNGGDSIYDSVPWFWSDQYDLKLQMVGFSSDGDHQVVRGDRKSRSVCGFLPERRCCCRCGCH